jgi:release factor glutamine methyltransferase
VNRSTLIPRPETELMIDTLKKEYRKQDRFLVWDIGTGSGAIAITVALEFPNAIIIASDICKRALKVAEKNAKLYSVEHRIVFKHANLLTAEIAKEIGDRSSEIGSKKEASLVILANLPYLPESDKRKLAKDVTGFEPAKALFSGKDGLDLIRALFAQISDNLNVNPDLILAEFDPPQKKIILKLAKDTFPIESITIHKDMAKMERLIEIS